MQLQLQVIIKRRKRTKCYGNNYRTEWQLLHCRLLCWIDCIHGVI